MDLKRSDFVAMGCIAAGVVFPSAFLMARADARPMNAVEVLEACEAEEEAAEVSVVIVESPRALVRVRRIDQEAEETKVRLTADKLRLTAAREQLQALEGELKAEEATLHLAIIEAGEQTATQEARARLLAEEVRALERQIEAERLDETLNEIGAAERYEIVRGQLEQALEAQVLALEVDDQRHKRKKRKRKHRRPC